MIVKVFPALFWVPWLLLACVAQPVRTSEPANPANEPWWSLQPLTFPGVPKLPSAGLARARTPIDAFVIHALRSKNLTLSPRANRRTLIRRLYFDLIGLPPAPTAVDAFVADDDPAAYARLVDQLLASPQYGERWARHWLDVVHYADTHGFDKDKVRPHAWPYRDYVVRAFNGDKPYSRFVREQLAGDEFYPGTADGVEALGFLAAGPFDWVGHIEVREGTAEKRRVRNLDRDDIVTTTMNTFVSMTAQCARCHDHKFDPISQRDYYGLQAVFAAVDRADRPYDTDLRTHRRRVALEAQEQRLLGHRKSLDAQIRKQAGPDLDELDRAIQQASSGQSAARPKDDPSSSKQAETAAQLEQRRKQLIEQRVDAATIGARDAVENQLDAVRRQKESLPPPRIVFAAATQFAAEGNFTPTGGQPRPIFILDRGDVDRPGAAARPGALPCVGTAGDHLADRAEREGRFRAGLANWIVDFGNPLTWRSIVNRLWQYHFGRGLVATPNDFGRMGALPTHLELLDWLAAAFRDGRQSMKDVHRLIVMSAVYRQASSHRAECASVDSANRFLWRMNRRRLEAEALRDTVLLISGKLDRKMGGPGFRMFDFKDGHSPHYYYDRHDPNDSACHRRTLYRFVVRSVPDPFMASLDCADPSISVARRSETITALQALAMLNNPFMVRMAEHFADALRSSSGTLPRCLEEAYRRAVSRRPSARELARLVPLAERTGLANVCRLIMNTNEFVFID